MAELDDKDDFVSLTEKQKAIVDVKAKHPEYGPEKTANEASKQLPGDETVSRSYVAPILNKYGHIIKDRREQLDNDRYEGTETTVGSPFDKLGEDQSWQGIKDRPEKPNGDKEITVRLSETDVLELINQEQLNEFDRKMLTRVVEAQFA